MDPLTFSLAHPWGWHLCHGGLLKTLLNIDMHHVKQRLTEHKKVSHCVCVYKEECSQSLIRWFSSSSSSQQQVNFLISDFTARPPTWTKHHDPGPADSLSLLKSTVLSSTDSILSHLQQKVFKCTNWPRLLTWSSSCAKKKKEAVEKKWIICILHFITLKEGFQNYASRHPDPVKWEQVHQVISLITATCTHFLPYYF